MEEAPRRVSLCDRPDVTIVDLRENSEAEKNGVILGSMHAPYPDLREHIAPGGMLHELVMATGKRIFYCAFGEHSAMAVQDAQDAGLRTACHIQGGIDALMEMVGV
jgi:sulfur dioxygenase